MSYLLAVVQERDRTVFITANLQLLAVIDDVPGLVRIARWTVDEMIDDHFVTLAVDGCVGLRRRSAECEREIADRHHDGAELHRILGAEILIREQAADQRSQINESSVAAVETRRLVVREEEMLGQV